MSVTDRKVIIMTTFTHRRGVARAGRHGKQPDGNCRELRPFGHRLTLIESSLPAWWQLRATPVARSPPEWGSCSLCYNFVSCPNNHS